MKLKTYIALSVLLVRVPAKHLAANGNCQFTILCRTTSKRRVAELIGSNASLYNLNYMGCSATDSPDHVAVCVKPDTIYYFMDNATKLAMDDFMKWIEYKGAADA